jgi:hypothetical protein
MTKNDCYKTEVLFQTDIQYKLRYLKSKVLYRLNSGFRVQRSKFINSSHIQFTDGYDYWLPPLHFQTSLHSRLQHSEVQLLPLAMKSLYRLSSTHYMPKIKQ